MVTKNELQELSLPELVSQYPAARPVLGKYGLLNYADSETAKHENLKASALVHSVNLDNLLTDLSGSLG